MKKFRQRAMCGLLGVSMAVSVFGGIPILTKADSTVTEVKVLGDTVELLGVEVIGVPKLEPAFSPDITSYTATTYRNTNALTLKPVAVDEQATVTVNGESLVSGYKDIPIELGENRVTIEVAKGEQTKVYEILVTKVDTDYRGRKALTAEDGISFDVTSHTLGHEIEKALDGDRSTYWQGEEKDNQEILIDLGKERIVSKIDYAPPSTAQTNYLKNGRMDKIEITVSTDGQNYTKVADTEMSAADWMYDNQTSPPAEGYTNQLHFVQTHARYIKMKVLDTYRDAAPLAGEITVFEDPEVILPEEDQTPLEPLKPVNPDISKSSDFVIQRGLQLPAWIATDISGRGYINKEEFEDLGITGVITYNPPLLNDDFLTHNPKAQWGIALGPYGTHPPVVPEDENYLHPKLEEYINNAATFCAGDEQPYSVNMINTMKQIFDITRDKYPNVINHSNQWHGQWNQEQLKNFMWVAKPEMFTYDYYPWSMGNIADYDSASSVASQANYQRQLALEGYDQSGEKPLVFGQYVASYNEGRPTVQTTESQRKSHLNISLAMGMKWLTLFRIEYSPEYCELFDADGAPTRHFYAWADAFEKAKNVGDHLVRLNSDYVALQPGQHMNNGQVVSNNIPSGYKLGGFKADKQYHIENVVAENLGVQNNKLAGDVVIGYLKPLQGLNKEQSELFTSKVPKYMMVVNGLMQGNRISPKEQHGTSVETTQKITLTFKDPEDEKALRRVNNETGEVENVELIPVVGEPGSYTVELILGGGEFELLFWEEDTAYTEEGEEEDDKWLVINDSQTGKLENEFDYEGTWTAYGKVPNNHLQDEHWSSTVGSSLTFRFSGTEFELYGITDVRHGKMAIFMDGEQVGIVDTYSEQRKYQQLLYKSPTLSDGEHTFRLEVLEEKNPSALDRAISLDKIIVENDKKVKLSKQQGSAVAGETSQVTYQVDTENIADGAQVNVRFKGMQGLPQGITVNQAEITNGKAEIIFEVANNAKVGDYYFEVIVAGVTTKIATLTVLKEKNTPQIELDALGTIESGKMIQVDVALKNTQEKVYAQDMEITYNEEHFELVSIEEKNATILVEESREVGKSRIILAKENGFINGEQVIALNFRAKTVEEETESGITCENVQLGIVKQDISKVVEGQGNSAYINIIPGAVVPEVDKEELQKTIQQAEKLSQEAVIGNEVGQYPENAKRTLDAAVVVAKDVEANSQDQIIIDTAAQTLKEAIKIFEDSRIKLEIEDINGDNRVDVADLALVAYYYHQKEQTSENWEEAQKADIDKSGEVDITDLTLVANKILMY